MCAHAHQTAAAQTTPPIDYLGKIQPPMHRSVDLEFSATYMYQTGKLDLDLDPHILISFLLDGILFHFTSQDTHIRTLQHCVDASLD